MARPKTKKRASKRVTSRKRRFFFPYPLFLFLMLCAGAFLVTATFKAGADDIVVTAAVHAPPVTSPALIINPASGTHFTSIPITVSGSCPSGAAYVEIFRNNLMSGSAICDSSSNFQLTIDLFPGQNELVAHVFNVTDDEGPVSGTVTIYYDVPQPPPGTSSTPKKAGPAAVSPLTLKTAFIYKGYYTGQEVEWPLQISGGVKPYALNVDWGDGASDVISRGGEGEFTIKHTYSKPGGYKGSYTVAVKASDSTGNKAYLQFFVIINSRNVPASAGNIYNKPPPNLDNNSWLWVVWPAYLLVLLLVLSYWLGEREEMIILRRKGLLRH